MCVCVCVRHMHIMHILCNILYAYISLSFLVGACTKICMLLVSAYYMRVFVCVHAHKSLYVYAYMCMHMCVCVSTSLSVQACVCT